MGRDLDARARDRDGRDRHRSSSHKKAKKTKDKKRHRYDDRTTSSNGNKSSIPPIGDDDFFLRATEFRVWLKQRRDQYVEELSSDEATRLFQTKFVPRWNAGRLDGMYYAGIPERVLEETKRTRHAWGFVHNLNDRERMDLATAKDSVGVATRKADLLVPHAPSRETVPVDHKRSRPPDEDDGEARRHRRRVDDKRKRTHQDTVLDELAPRETGREAILEKRRQVADKVHGAARDRDANRDGLDLDEAFLMGGGSHDKAQFQRRLASRADARQRREDDLRERAAAAQAKETARMDKFLQDMGIDPSGKRPLTIQPRRDS